MTTARIPSGSAAAATITKRIRDLADWRGDTLARVRQLILAADPAIVEEWKWVKPSSPGIPVWSRHGGICTGEVYQAVVKLTFFRGASVPDPQRLFNASLKGGTRRAIDLREGDTLNPADFKKLIRSAVAVNAEVQSRRPPSRKK